MAYDSQSIIDELRKIKNRLNGLTGGGGGSSSGGPVVDGVDATLKATVTASKALKVDPSAITQPVSAASLPLPTGAATEATLAGIKTGTDKIPASPAQEHATAASPHTARLSDGTNFYDAGKTGQLPASLGQTTMAGSFSVTIASNQSAVPISAASLPLPAGASTEATLALIKAKTDNLDVLLSTRTKPADTQPVSAAALPLPAGASTEATLAGIKTGTDKIPTSPAQEHVTAASPGSHRLSDGTNFYDATKTGQLPTTLGQKTMANSVGVSIASDQSAVPISAASLPLPAGASTETTLAGIKTGTDKIPASPSTDRTTAAAPFSTELSDGAAFYTAAKTGQFPSALVGGRLDSNIGAWLGSTAPTVGQKTMANSIPMTIASDQAAFPVSQSGANWSVNVAQVGGVTVAATVKGTQGTNFIPAQDAKDSGRQQIMLSWERLAGGASESALVNFTNGVRNATALTAASSYTVSAGKTLRIQAIHITVRASATTLVNSRVRIRQAASSIANTSPIIWMGEVGLPSATTAAEEEFTVCFTIPDGLEVAAAQQITQTHLESSATGTVSIVLVGYEY